jgi:hypothetical protein
MFLDGRLDDVVELLIYALARASLIRSHETAVAHYVSSEYGGEAALHRRSP